MNIIMPESFSAILGTLALSSIVTPIVHVSTDGKFDLVIQDDRLALRTNSGEKDFYAILKIDLITMASLREALMNCYVYAKGDPHYRVKFTQMKIDPKDRMKSILDFEFWVGRDDAGAWIMFPAVQGHGDVRFNLPVLD